MIARGSERGELAALLESTGFGVAVIVGAAGIGKTTLWEEALRRGNEASWRVLRARAAQSETRLTYVGLGDLLAGVEPEVLNQLAPPLRRALEIALLRAEPDTEPLAQRTVAAAFLSVLQILARARRVLVAVDDAEWLDAPSAAVLEFATRRLEAEPVKLLLTQRSDAPEPFALERAASRLQRIELGPLSLGALHQLIRDATGRPLSRRLLLEFERLSGGNPLFALELVRGGYADGTPPPLPITLGHAMLERISALPAATRDELLIVALAARPTVELVDRAAIRASEEAGIVRAAEDGSVSFVNPLLRWAMLSLVNDTALSHAHLRLAEQSRDLEERVHHRALAAHGADAALAGELEEQAMVARARGAPAAAAELLAHARRLTPADAHEDWARRARREIPLLLSAGDCGPAWTLGEEALRRLPAGVSRAAVLLAAAEAHPGAGELCERALIEAGGDRDVSIRGHLHLALQRIYAFETAPGIEHANIAVAMAREHGDPVLLITALTQRAAVMLTGGLGDPTPDLVEAIRLERDEAIAPLPAGCGARYYRAVWQTCSGELEPARATIQELLVQATELADERSQTNLRSALGAVELRLGNGARAREELEAALALSDLMEFGRARCTQRAWLAAARFRDGAFEDARLRAEEAIALSGEIGDVPGRLVGLATLADVALAHDEPAAALPYVEEIRRFVPTTAAVPIWLEFEETEARALATVGRLDEAETRCDAMLETTAAAVRARSVLLAASGKLPSGVAALERLVIVEPFEAARTLLLKGQLERRAKRKAAARDSLLFAAGLFRELGAEGWVEKVSAETSRLGLRRAVDGLTETEQRVAQLAAAGRSNREIAASLFISRRTVEANIARIYRKLDVNTRTALASRLTSGSGPVA